MQKLTVEVLDPCDSRRERSGEAKEVADRVQAELPTLFGDALADASEENERSLLAVGALNRNQFVLVNLLS